MPISFVDRLQHAWNAFVNKDPTRLPYPEVGMSSFRKPDRIQLRYSSERTIISSLYTRIGIDAAAVNVHHVLVDENNRFLEQVPSRLNECLTLQANLDQSGRALIQDIIMSLCDEGVVAIVPVETSVNPNRYGGFDIHSLRVGKITEWFPTQVRIELYNEKLGRREEIIMDKRIVAIVENPLYAVMNEPNSTLKRLTHKLSILDSIDNQSASGKLDLIIQLPYVIKSEARRLQAKQRKTDIEDQLVNSKYGIAYTDASEKITQLNRPAENNLMAQIQYLTTLLYNQLGISERVFDGSAEEAEMLNYYNRTIEPLLAAVVDAMNSKFLTKTARTRRHKIMYFREPFKLVPINNLAEIVDKFSRNEILSSNEIRAVIGYKPVDDPKADELRNKNLNQSAEQENVTTRIEGEE